MKIEASGLLSVVVIGIGATAIMDLWALVLKRAFRIPAPNYCLVGRWIYHMPRTFRHASIAAATPRRGECAVGWIVHYGIGIAYAVAFVALAPADWLARPTLSFALAFGIFTALFPFLIMQPAFGLGVAASRTPDPAGARLKSLFAHAIFGAGLYLCALGARYAL